MSNPVTYPGFIGGVVVAFICAMSASAGVSLFEPFLHPGDLVLLVIAGVTLLYLLYIFHCSNVKTGRVSVLLFWVIGTAVAAITYLPPEIFLAANLLTIWLVRTIFFKSRLPGALADLGLIGFGVIVALWAAMHTGSYFLAVWSFLLIQALFVFIPGQCKPGSQEQSDLVARSERQFEASKLRAEVALRHLSQH